MAEKIDKKLPYSFGIVTIVVFVFSFLCVLLMAISFGTSNRNLEVKLENLEQAITQTDTEVLTGEMSAFQFQDEIDLLKEQYDSFIDNLTIILSVFALLVAICTIIMPIYTHNFLQKDQIKSFQDDTTEALLNFKNDTNSTISAVAETNKKYSKEIRSEIELLKSTKRQFDDWMNDLFSPLDFSEIRIEPVYNIPFEEIDQYYRKAYLDFTYGKVNKALERLDLILKSDPLNEKVLFAKAQVLYSTGDYSCAVETIDKLISNCNKSVYYYVRGCIKFKIQNYSAAVSDFMYVYNHDSSDEQNLVKLAAALHKNRQTSQAIIYQNEAIKINGNVAQYYADRGIMYHALKHYDLALNDKKQAIELAKDNSQYYGIYAATLYKLKRYDDAIDYASFAIDKEPNTAFAYSFRGLAKSNILDKYKMEDILSDLNKAVDLDRNNHRNFSRRAEYYLSVNNTQLALQDLNEAVKIDSLDPEVMHLFSLVYQMLGDDETALFYKEKAMNLGYIVERKTD